MHVQTTFTLNVIFSPVCSGGTTPASSAKAGATNTPRNRMANRRFLAFTFKSPWVTGRVRLYQRLACTGIDASIVANNVPKWRNGIKSCCGKVLQAASINGCLV